MATIITPIHSIVRAIIVVGNGHKTLYRTGSQATMIDYEKRCVSNIMHYLYDRRLRLAAATMLGLYWD